MVNAIYKKDTIANVPIIIYHQENLGKKVFFSRTKVNYNVSSTNNLKNNTTDTKHDASIEFKECVYKSDRPNIDPSKHIEINISFDGITYQYYINEDTCKCESDYTPVNEKKLLPGQTITSKKHIHEILNEHENATTIYKEVINVLNKHMIHDKQLGDMMNDFHKAHEPDFYNKNTPLDIELTNIPEKPLDIELTDVNPSGKPPKTQSKKT